MIEYFVELNSLIADEFIMNDIISLFTQGSLFYYVSPKDINSMWYGKSEQNLSHLFSDAKHAARMGDRTAIIFFDELDGFYSDRSKMHEATRRTFGQLCTELDGKEDKRNIIIIGASNRYKDLDPALTRSSRFDHKIFFNLPDDEAREKIFSIHLRDKPIAPDVNFSEFARLTSGFSGAEIAETCQKATFIALRQFSAQKKISIPDIRGSMLNEISIHTDDLRSAII